MAKGENVNSRDGMGDTGLVWEVSEGRNAIVKLLLETPGIDVNQKRALKDWIALDTAAVKGNLQAVQFLLATNCVNVNSKYSKGCTALHLAALGGKVEIVQLILADEVELEVDVNSESDTDVTPLQVASYYGHSIVVQLLLSWLTREWM